MPASRSFELSYPQQKFRRWRPGRPVLAFAGAMAVTIFISCRVEEDRSLAQAFRYYLTSLGESALQTLTCEHISGGTKWRDWIERNAGEADTFLLLYTNGSADWACASGRRP